VANIEAAMRAINSGEIYRFLTKPWDDLELCLTIRSAMEKHDLEAENRRLLDTVKRQAMDIRVLEKTHPGISDIERDANGHLLIPEVSDDETSRFMDELDRKYGS